MYGEDCVQPSLCHLIIVRNPFHWSNTLCAVAACFLSESGTAYSNSIDYFEKAEKPIHRTVAVEGFSIHAGVMTEFGVIRRRGSLNGERCFQEWLYYPDSGIFCPQLHRLDYLNIERNVEMHRPIAQ